MLKLKNVLSKKRILPSLTHIKLFIPKMFLVLSFFLKLKFTTYKYIIKSFNKKQNMGKTKFRSCSYYLPSTKILPFNTAYAFGESNKFLHVKLFGITTCRSSSVDYHKDITKGKQSLRNSLSFRIKLTKFINYFSFCSCY